MKKKVFILILLILGFLSLVFLYPKLKEHFFPFSHIETEVYLNPKEKILAIYNPESNRFIPNENISHITINLTKDDWNIDMKKLSSFEKQDVVISIRIWERSILDRLNSDTYDLKLKKFFSEIGKTKFKKLYIRWLPGMELPDNANPWGNRGYFYNNSFSKISKLISSEIPESKLMWSPAGYSGLMEYFPIDSYEAAGVSLINDQRSLFRMRFNQKPLFIFSEDPDQDLETIKEWCENINFEIGNELIDPEKYEWREDLQLGSYDPDMQLVNHPAINFELLFADLEDVQNGNFQKKFDEILSRKNIPFITFEPEDPQKRKDNQILIQMINGEYDHILNEFYQTILEAKTEVYLRYAHEMEIPIHRYPWQSQKPELYIRAFQDFMSTIKDVERIKKVWSPAGDRESMDFWPGKDHVDYIGMSIYGLPDKGITDVNKQESFYKIYHRKKQRLELLPKPFIVAEFGVKGDDKYQLAWMKVAAEILNHEYRIKAANYFNYSDVPEAWGKKIDPPVWKISDKTFEIFSSKLQR